MAGKEGLRGPISHGPPPGASGQATKQRLRSVCNASLAPRPISAFPARLTRAGKMRVPPARGVGAASARGFSGNKRLVPQGSRRGSHGNAGARNSPPVRAAGGCAAEGALLLGRRGGRPLAHLHLGLRRLWSSPPASAPELLTEKRNLSSQGVLPMELRATKEGTCYTLQVPKQSSPPAPRPRCGDTRHCFTVVFGPSDWLRGLVSIDPQK